MSDKLGIIPPSGQYGLDWPSHHVLTQGKNGSLSDAGWTEGNEGIPQQTFLGASIRSFSLNAGFGDSASTLSVELVNDEYNISDLTELGSGDDPYHNGSTGDQFSPPVVGTPVFFKFGTNPATVEQAFRKTFDDTYPEYGDTLQAPVDFVEVVTNGEIERVPGLHHYLRKIENKGERNQKNTWVDKSPLWKYDTQWRGKDHLAFGGILQTYTQNRGAQNGDPLYSLQLTDPREILSNATVILNNYGGTTYNNKNLLNVFGFLEHDPSEPLLNALKAKAISINPVNKVINHNTGGFAFIGDDNYHFFDALNPFQGTYGGSFFSAPPSQMFPDQLGKKFPITGQGFARRSERGMPWYRVRDGLAALMNYNGFLPTEYKDAGYGGAIDFRGFKYVVDFGGIPLDLIPPTYFLEFDQIDLLSLAQELCDVISHDLFVTLLPVIDHPSCKIMYDFNQDIIRNYSNPSNPLMDFRSQMIAGIIRVDAIDKRKPPTAGAIKSFLDDLRGSDVEVENQDLGYELSNVTTDKFVTGAQEVDMYYFTTNKDRNDVELRKHRDGLNSKIHLLEREKWSLETMLKQQVIPFYGFIGNDKAVTIPKGFGSYQQICLDSSALNAFGVGNYYIATEIELRAALVSYQQWKRFLLEYDEQWMRRLRGPEKTFDAHVPADVQKKIDDLAGPTGLSGEVKEILKACFDGDYGVSVPRSVWRSDKNYMGDDGYPASPCSPPYGYPLYYKRAEKIGIPEAGIIKLVGASQQIVSNIQRIKDKTDKDGPYFSMVSEEADEAIKKIEHDIRLKRLQIKLAQSNPNSKEAMQKMQEALLNLELALFEAKEFAKKIEEQFKQVEAADQAILAEIRTTIKNNERLIKNVGRMAKDSEKNAKKVYDFIRGVAEANLGKKFLVKIPKKTNMHFTDQVSFWQNSPAAQSIKTGPFGFKPLPVTATANYYHTSTDWISTFRQLKGSISFDDAFEDYLDFTKRNTSIPSFERGYNNGALKCNYNPFADKWEYNYKPEPQGGFVNHELRGFKQHPSFYSDGDFDQYRKSNMSADLRNALTPLDAKNLMSDNNRMSCYVRFDNSHIYDFSKIAKDSLCQQSINSFGFITPDVMEELDNVNPDQKMSMEQYQQRKSDNKLLDRQNPSLAFVKCTVDEEFYMPPPMTIVPTKVFARDFKVVVPVPKLEIIKVPLDDDPATPEDESKCLVPSGVVRKVIPVFSPHTPQADNTTVNTIDYSRRSAVDGKAVYKQTIGANATFGRFAGDIARIDRENVLLVNSLKTQQASDHVYALVTLPGMVTSTLDIRYCDSNNSVSTATMYNLQTRDVVKGLQEFNKPAVITNGGAGRKCENLKEFTIGEINDAIAAQKQALKLAATSSLQNGLSLQSPSPVYPDMVAIPLMSLERSYGPWLSNASIDPYTQSPGVSNIGGKIEFEQDENLAPWNFGGYQLMNEAGYLRAQFSNSLLLFSERGGFVIPKAPTGVSLAKTLKLGGPLVTSIDVGVSDTKISTTIKMDLYTSSFGKLQKQKEGNIAQMTRERQKIKDMRNNEIRRGMGKALSSKNFYQAAMQGGGAELLQQLKATENHFSDFEKGKTNLATEFIVGKTSWNMGEPVDFNGTATSYGKDLVKRGANAVIGNLDTMSEVLGISDEVEDFKRNANNFISKSITDFLSLVPRNTNDPNEVQTPPQNRKNPEDRQPPGGGA